MAPARIHTFIFDMDGLLLDTEPLWGVSMNRVADRHGIGVSKARFKETTGLRIYEVTEYWSRHFPWQGSTPQEVADEILDDIIERAQQQGSAMPGVLSLLELLKSQNLKIGLATSSPDRMMRALLTHFDLEKFFDYMCSADEVAMGKPHPAVFLHCAEMLGSAAHECLVLEDSVNGAIAGKAARMSVLAVPDALHWDDPRFSIADFKLHSLEEIDAVLLKKICA
ncbi:MAG: hexitol phosphatase HxpB [Bacteroidetes bacterium]|nr:hexitol phosphatase HxpB [Bacteroidota bacterium]MBS1630039.1 hexitol phosphatase HxpB [Bacteroidota bacterium]